MDSLYLNNLDAAEIAYSSLYIRALDRKQTVYGVSLDVVEVLIDHFHNETGIRPSDLKNGREAEFVLKINDHYQKRA